MLPSGLLLQLLWLLWGAAAATTIPVTAGTAAARSNAAARGIGLAPGKVLQVTILWVNFSLFCQSSMVQKPQGVSFISFDLWDSVS